MSFFETSVHRRMMINQLHVVWSISEEEILNLVAETVDKMDEANGRLLMESFGKMKHDLVETLVFSNTDYQREENPTDFRNMLETLVDIFRDLYCSLLVPDVISEQDVNDMAISSLNFEFYEELRVRQQLPDDKYVPQAYPPITTVIRFVRNCQLHTTHKPIDFITQKNSFGNIYTLVSIVILSIYAYQEILSRWLEVI